MLGIKEKFNFSVIRRNTNKNPLLPLSMKVPEIVSVDVGPLNV